MGNRKVAGSRAKHTEDDRMGVEKTSRTEKSVIEINVVVCRIANHLLFVFHYIILIVFASLLHCGPLLLLLLLLALVSAR